MIPLFGLRTEDLSDSLSWIVFAHFDNFNAGSAVELLHMLPNLDLVFFGIIKKLEGNSILSRGCIWSRVPKTSPIIGSEWSRLNYFELENQF